MKRAIYIIWKELNKAMKYHSRIKPNTKITGGYISKSVFSSAGGFKPAYWYANTIYVLNVDFKGLKAVYKPLISQDHIIKLYSFVEDHPEKCFSDTFGFTQKEFLDLMENCTK